MQIFSGLMVINALRMLPVMVKGFQFLSQVKVHMKSYRAPLEEDSIEELSNQNYPKCLRSDLNVITQPTHSLIKPELRENLRKL